MSNSGGVTPRPWPDPRTLMFFYICFKLVLWLLSLSLYSLYFIFYTLYLSSLAIDVKREAQFKIQFRLPFIYTFLIRLTSASISSNKKVQEEASSFCGRFQNVAIDSSPVSPQLGISSSERDIVSQQQWRHLLVFGWPDTRLQQGSLVC